MSNEGAAEMASGRCTSPALEPLDDDDLLAKILLRLPPMPSSLPRASLVCKRWRSIATDAAFRHPPDRIPAERFSLDLSADDFFTWRALGCRHGRVLLINPWAPTLLVFEPVSGDTHRIIIPLEFVRDGFSHCDATVLCAAGDDQDHVHGGCHSSPFKVVFVETGRLQQAAVARVYSSQTGVWGDLVSTTEPCTGGISRLSRALVGIALYWSLIGSAVRILQFDLDKQSLTVIDGPPAGPVDSQIQIIRAEDGGLGLAILSYPSIQLWDRKVDCHGVATWVPRKTLNMDKMLGRKADSAHIAGYAEDVDAIFLSMYKAPVSDPSTNVLVIVHLESLKVGKHRGGFHRKDYHLFTNFYTAGTARA